MGTRSLTYVHTGHKAQKGKILCVMYRQFDGYPSGHGRELSNFLVDRKLLNGIGAENHNKLSNGIGNMAVQMIQYFMNMHHPAGDAGSFYLQTPKFGLDCWQDYEYHIYPNQVIVIGISNSAAKHTDPDRGTVVFCGDWQQFHDFCNQPEEE